MTGKQYADLIASYIVTNYGKRGLKVYREITLGKTIIGKNRKVDLFIVHEASNAALAQRRVLHTAFRSSSKVVLASAVL